jgi:membrane protease YdiL (CAAX protease family)
MWLAIGGSSLLFAALHLPAAASMLGSLSMDVVSYILLWNTVFGTVFGYLYWRFGLEAAILAHAFMHLVFAVLRLT